VYTALKLFPFFGSKIAIYLFLGLHKGSTRYKRAFSPQKRTSSASEHENSLLLLYLWVIFALLDPDSATQIKADPCGSGGSTTLALRENIPYKKV
jgi:hypothetical protein